VTPAEFRDARQRLGLTGVALAALLRVDDRTIRRWELGERAVPGPVVVLVSILESSPECRAAVEKFAQTR
jgi:DNA-binding transcriptional regulator YiaG